MFARVTYLERKKAALADALVLCVFFVFLFYFISFARQWAGDFRPEVTIDLSPWALPKYALFSLLRAFAAYACSFVFTLVIGFAAAKSKVGERILLPLLDIGQSIPVLGFMPGFVMGLIALFPRHNLGLELACILLIFTGQVWNMTFSLYSSLKAVPTSYFEMSKIVGLTPFERFRKIELPSSAINLTWNSMMSMAGGWFFLIACESFTLGSQQFRLPGIGAYMTVAMEREDHRAIFLGILAMCLVIILVDFGIWRPIIAWSRKFRFEEHQGEVDDIPFVSILLKESKILFLFQKLFFAIREYRYRERVIPSTTQFQQLNPLRRLPRRTLLTPRRFTRKYVKKARSFLFRLAPNAAIAAAILLALWGLSRLYELTRTLEIHDWFLIGQATGFTLLRVFAALILGSIWTIPFGVWVGLSIRRTRFVQPIIQVAASFPAPMLYPIVMFILLKMGIGLSVGSMFLMLMGVQWYILFNVLAGAMGVPKEFQDTLKLIGLRRVDFWKKLYLPAIFPALITGWITAAGGAWNASIVAEYVQYQGGTLTTNGIGALITQATEKGDFHLLAGCLLAMVITVVGINRLVWRRVQRYAESHFKLEG